MLRQRIKKLEEKIRPKHGGIKAWVLTGAPEVCAKQMADIESGKIKHSDGSCFSPQDSNYFISEAFTPKLQEAGKNGD